MKSLLKKVYIAVSVTMLPIIYGCNPGSGSSGASGVDSSSLLFGGTGNSLLSEGTTDATTQVALSAVSAADVATITNPEPATMLLLGGGMAAMAYLKSKKNHL